MYSSQVHPRVASYHATIWKQKECIHISPVQVDLAPFQHASQCRAGTSVNTWKWARKDPSCPVRWALQFQPTRWKGKVCLLMHCGCHSRWAESVLAAARWFTTSLTCLAARRNSLWSCRSFNVFTFWCCYPQVLWVFCRRNFQETVRFRFLR